MLNIPFFEAIELEDRKLDVLYNEAYRQRMLDVQTVAMGSNPPKNLNQTLQKAMKCHGPYTEGFHEEEMNKLFNDPAIPKV